MPFRFSIHLLFFIISAMILLVLSGHFFHIPAEQSTDNARREIIDSFYKEPRDIDGLIIGLSSVYRDFSPVLAWHFKGITVLNLASPWNSYLATPFLIKEALRLRRYHFIAIDIINFVEPPLQSNNVHFLLNFLKPSLNKIALTLAFCREKPQNKLLCLEYFLPIIRFHARWKEGISSTGYLDVKGSFTLPFHFETQKIKSNFKNKRPSFSPKAQKELHALIDFCETLSVPVIFIAAPTTSEKYQEQLEIVGRLITARGHPFINTTNRKDEIGLRVPDDFSDENHLNINGTIKYTIYMSDLFQKKYNLTDKRGNRAYVDWRAAYQHYYEAVAAYISPFFLKKLNKENIYDY